MIKTYRHHAESYNMQSDKRSDESVYLYQPSHALPIVFAVLVGLSLLAHIYQNL